MTAARHRQTVAFVVLLVVAVGADAAWAGKGPAFRYTLIDRFGKAGTGPGEFPGTTAGPRGIAVDRRCGDVYVSDESKSRVQRFSQTGKFLNYVGTPDGDDGFLARGELDSPAGLDVYVAVGPDNFYGPPAPCSAVTTLTTNVWIADTTGNRVAIFEPSGSWTGSWCESDLDKDACDISEPGTIDYYPNDVEVTDNRVYVAGISRNTVREYDRQGNYLRETNVTVNSASSISVFGGQLWVTERYESKVGLFSLDPGNASINRYLELGSAFSPAPGKFTYVKAVETAPNGTLFVLDNDERVLVFLPSGQYLTEFELPDDAAPEDIAVRFDGTLYIADNSRNRPGVLVYSPGPPVSLKLKRAGGKRIRLTGRVGPTGHPGARVKLQRLEGLGWHDIARAKLDAGSKFEYEWRAPRSGRTYVMRAFFKDPHRYHANRASQRKQIALR